MQEKKVKSQITNIKLALSYAKDQLLRAEDSIRFATQELDRVTLALENRSTQKGMHVCNCEEKTCEDVTSTSGEKTKKEAQRYQDLATSVDYCWSLLESEGQSTPSRRFLIMR